MAHFHATGTVSDPSKIGPYVDEEMKILADLQGEGVVSPAPGPAEAAELADVAARVRGAVAALPDGQRNAVLLFYLQGLSHREVAAELGISVGAVKARLHQARASLAPRLASVADFQEETTMTTQAAEWIDVSVSEIRRSRGDDEDEWQRKFVMVLAERGGERKLPIWIGPAEAISLAMELESAETPRPFTYKLAAGLVGAAGAQVAEVRITRLMEEVFYASVLVDGPAVDERTWTGHGQGRARWLDCRGFSSRPAAGVAGASP